MQQSPSQRDKLFDLICRLLGGEEEAWGRRLVSAPEIAARLLRYHEAEALIRIGGQGRPGTTPEQLAGEFVVSLAESATRIGSEWHALVEAVQVQGEWFLRLKPQRVHSYTEPAGAQRNV